MITAYDEAKVRDQERLTEDGLKILRDFLGDENIISREGEDHIGLKTKDNIIYVIVRGIVDVPLVNEMSPEDVDYSWWYGVGVGVWRSEEAFALGVPAVEVPPGSKWLDMGESQLNSALAHLKIYAHKGQIIFYKVVREGIVRSTEEEIRDYLKFRGA